MTKRCAKCLLSEHFPNGNIDAAGVCRYCREWQATGQAAYASVREDFRKKMEEVIAASKQGKEYDAIVAFSGGKDSTYTLMLLKEKYGLNLLAFTIDNGFLAGAALRNARTVCDRLGVDWILYRPSQSFLKTVYRNSLAKSPYDTKVLVRSSEVCASCIQIVNASVLREAVRRDIPLIAGGYIGAQVPADMPVMKAYSESLEAFRKKNLDSLNAALHPQFSHYVSLTTQEKSRMTESPNVINPLLAQDYEESRIIEEIGKIGWEMPERTGKNSSNCLLNEYGIQEHLKKYNFHPYELEICQQVRLGFLSPTEGLERLNCRLDDVYYDGIRRQLES